MRLIVGRLSVGICGDGGRKVGNCGCGASSLELGSVAFGGSLGEAEKGTENRGRNLGLLLAGSLASLVSMRIGSFSDRISVVGVAEGGGGEAKGLNVRIGMVLVL